MSYREEEWKPVGRSAGGRPWLFPPQPPLNLRPTHRPTSERRRRPKITIFGLLVAAFVVGFPYFYFTKCFHIRYFEDPKEGLTYVDTCRDSQLNDFRKHTVANLIDPALVQLDRIKALRKKSHFGKIRPAALEAEANEIRLRLRDLMDEARLRRIPKQYRRQYERLIMGLKYGYDSVNYLEASLLPEAVSPKESYTNGVKAGKKSKRGLMIAREFFRGNDWESTRSSKVCR